MRLRYLNIILVVLLFSCNEKKEISSINPDNWAKRAIDLKSKDSLEYGKSYLSIYSQVYSRTEHDIQNLTAIASIRNKSETDTIYILRAEYYDTHGKSVRKYIDAPIYLSPLETVEIVIEENDTSGGTGSNFIFEWKIPNNSPEPLFEGIMTSNIGHQGLSFTTKADRIK